MTDTHLADDIGLYGMTYEATQRMLDAVIRETKAAGLSINVAKTKYIVRGDLVATPGTITVEGAPIERVKDFKYLGSYVGSVSRDIEERCKAASRAYGRLMPVWKAQLGLQTKLRVFKAMVEPVLFYACETWPLTVRREKRLTSHWFKLIRQILNRRWPYVWQTDESILSEFDLKSPAKTLRERFLKHLGHALRTSLREKSAGVKLSPQAMGVLWIGEHELRYTRGGVVRRRRVQRRGKGNLCTLFSYCLLGRRIGDSMGLMALAQRKETWRRLAESL